MIAQVEFCSVCDAEIGEHGHCRQCGHDIGAPVLLELPMPKATADHRQAVLDARKIIDYLRANPEGATSAQIKEATGIAGGLIPYSILEKHRLVGYEQGKPRVWFAYGRRAK